MAHINVPSCIEVAPAASERLKECEQFLDNVKEEALRAQLADTLQNSLETIGRIAKNADNKGTLSTDFAPLSFTWTAGGLRGGLIFHGPHDQYGSGAAPTFSVSCQPTCGWQLHT